MLAILALCIAVILTDSSRASTQANPTTWAAALALTGLNLISVMSKDPLTMAIAWAVTDVVELVYVLTFSRNSGSTNKVTTIYGVRLISTFVLVAATAVGWQVTAGLDFTQSLRQPACFSLLRLGCAWVCCRLISLSKTPWKPGMEPIYCCAFRQWLQPLS